MNIRRSGAFGGNISWSYDAEEGGSGGRSRGRGGWVHVHVCARAHASVRPCTEEGWGAHFVVGNAVVAQHGNEDEWICGAVVLDDVDVGVHTKDLHPSLLLPCLDIMLDLYTMAVASIGRHLLCT